MFLLGARTDLILSHQWYNVLWHYNNIARVKYCSDHGSEGMTDWLPVYTTPLILRVAVSPNP